MIAAASVAFALAALHVVQATNWEAGESEARYFPKGWVVPVIVENRDLGVPSGKVARYSPWTYYRCLEQYFQDATVEEQTPENWAETEKYCAERAGEVHTIAEKAPPLRRRLEEAPGSLENLQLIRNLEDKLLEQEIREGRMKAAEHDSSSSEQGTNGNRNAFSRLSFPSLKYFQQSLKQAFAPDRRAQPGWSQVKTGVAPIPVGRYVSGR